jgi:hypothetical protein
MHPEFSQTTIQDQNRHLDQQARRAFVGATLTGTTPESDDAVELRLCRVDDDAPLERLAMLEGRPSPAGRYIIAEVNGSVVAAMSLVSGVVLADPFESTGNLIPLLRMRAEQLAPEIRGSRGLPLWGAVRSWGRASA